jgi:hypothetical protein
MDNVQNCDSYIHIASSQTHLFRYLTSGYYIECIVYELP